MTNNIKTISLEKFSENSDNTGNPQFYLSSRNVNKISPNVPYRSDYFFVSGAVCLTFSYRNIIFFKIMAESGWFITITIINTMVCLSHALSGTVCTGEVVSPTCSMVYLSHAVSGTVWDIKGSFCH